MEDVDTRSTKYLRDIEDKDTRNTRENGGRGTRNTKYLRENGWQLKPLVDKRESGTGVDRDVEYDVPGEYLLILGQSRPTAGKA